MIMRRLIALLSLGLLLAATHAACAGDLVVIVNPASGVDKLSREDAINIFMGRYRKLPSGLVAFPIDLGGSDPGRKRFYNLLVNKEPEDIDAYWARLVFSGQTTPPRQVPDGKIAMQLVSINRNAIAYVDRDLVDGHVRVVLELEHSKP